MAPDLAPGKFVFDGIPRVPYTPTVPVVFPPPTNTQAFELFE